MPTNPKTAELFQQVHRFCYGPGNGVGSLCTYEGSCHTVTGRLFSYNVLAVNDETANNVGDELRAAFCAATNVHPSHVSIDDVNAGQPTWHAVIKVSYNVEAPTDLLPAFYEGQKVTNAETTVDSKVTSVKSDGSVHTAAGGLWPANITLPLQHKALICASLNVHNTMLQLYSSDSRAHHEVPHNSVTFDDEKHSLQEQAAAHTNVALCRGRIVALRGNSRNHRIFCVVDGIDDDNDQAYCCQLLANGSHQPLRTPYKSKSLQPVSLMQLPKKFHNAYQEYIISNMLTERPPPAYAEP